MKNTLIILLAFIAQNCLNGQLLENRQFFPGTSSIKGKYYNGCSKGYWDVKIVDSKGRIIDRKSYKKKDLLSHRQFEYDCFNNEVLSLELFDINNPNQTDTSWTRSYKYQNDEIISQTTKFSPDDSTTINLMNVIGDTLYVYMETSFHKRPSYNKHWQHSTEHRIIKNSNGQIKKWERINTSDNDREIKNFYFYPNGKLKRRTIKRIPEPKLKGVYTGSPGSDDQSWRYKYDKKGRAKVVFTIVNGKRFKIAKYAYDK